jgi:hypothetical protein
VLVAEELLDLAEVRAGSEELRGKDVSKGVGRDALAFVDAGGVDVVAEHLAELRVVEPAPLHADEDRLLRQRDAGGVVLGEEEV